MHTPAAIRGLVGAAMLSAIGVPSVHAVTYDSVDVSILFSTISADTPAGTTSGQLFSSYLPIALDQRSVTFDMGAAAAGGIASGTWTYASTDGVHSLQGTFQTTTLIAPGPDSFYLRHEGTLSVAGGTGYYADAYGSGSWESFSVLSWQDDLLTQYQSLNVSRMSVSLPTGDLAPRDVRPVSVVVGEVVQDPVAGGGYTDSSLTSRSDSELPPLLHSEFDFLVATDTEPFQGTFRDYDPAGNSMSGVVEPDIVGTSWVFGSNFSHTLIDGRVTDGTGAYENYAGSRQYDAFNYMISVGSETEVARFAEVGIIRYDVLAVPEPETWMLMGFGLAGLGWMARRRQMVAA